MKEMITYLVLIALLFLIVFRITQNNLKKTGIRKKSSFKTRYQERKKEAEQEKTNAS
ncbi:MAG: hypothetical protein ACK4K1_07565 [Flavobacterium sp.]